MANSVVLWGGYFMKRKMKKKIPFQKNVAYTSLTTVIFYHFFPNGAEGGTVTKMYRYGG